MGYWQSDTGYICVLRVEETLCKQVADCPFPRDEDDDYGGVVNVLYLFLGAIILAGLILGLAIKWGLIK